MLYHIDVFRLCNRKDNSQQSTSINSLMVFLNYKQNCNHFTKIIAKLVFQVGLLAPKLALSYDSKNGYSKLFALRTGAIYHHHWRGNKTSCGSHFIVKVWCQRQYFWQPSPDVASSEVNIGRRTLWVLIIYLTITKKFILMNNILSQFLSASKNLIGLIGGMHNDDLQKKANETSNGNCTSW